MSEVEITEGQLQMMTKLLWFLFGSFIIFLLLTAILIVLHGNSVQLSLIFEDSLGNLFGIILVFVYFAGGLPATYYLYKRALLAERVKVIPYSLAPVITGVVAPYVYALLLSFMGIMRDILPILFIMLLYIMGIIVGLRIIPDLSDHLKSE